MNPGYTAIILAAGKGSRVGSNLKAFLEIGRAPLIFHLLNSILQTNVLKIIIVINSIFTEEHTGIIKNFTGDRAELEFVVQTEQLGTGHATKAAIESCQINTENLLVFYVDTPFISPSNINSLLLNLTTGIFCCFKEKKGQQYGEVILESNSSKIDKIIEYKDREITESDEYILYNSGIIACKTTILTELLGRIEKNNKANEYYLPDIIKFEYKFDYLLINPLEALGINTFADFSEAQARWLSYQLNFWQNESGIFFVGYPNNHSVEISFGCKFGKKCKIGTGVIFKNNVVLEDEVEIEGNNVIGPNVYIGKNTLIRSFCYIENSSITENCIIGPFAHIDSSELGKQNIIGNFVEIKRTEMLDNNKVKHLAYTGDCVIGSGNNFGAGSVTCNFDGKKKHKTTIGDDNLIGANSSIIAPKNIGNKNCIAAGSVITKDVQEKTLAIARSTQVNKNKKEE